MAAVAFLALLLFTFVQTVTADDSLRTLAVLQGEAPGEHLGRSMAGVGDVNGDGLADFLVGDARDGWLPGERRCYLYFGGSSIDTIPDLVIHQSESDTLEPHTDDDDHFGKVVSGGHDIDRDGFDDILVTSPDWFWSTGKTYLYNGGLEVDLEPSIALAGYGSTWMTHFWNTQLRGELVRDVNGDEYDDIICLVGPSNDAGAHLYFGGAPMDSIHDLSFRGIASGVVLGSDIAGGDLNGDGYGDLVIGSSYFGDPGASDAAWIYFGGELMDTIPDVRLKPLGAPFSSHVCIPGDVNGDEFEDVAICAGGPDQHPWAFVYCGGAGMDSIVDHSIRGEYYWGPVLRLAGGDVDRDGFDDLIVSEVAYAENEGKIGIYFGGTAMDTIPDTEVYGEGAFGEMLTWIGDMTGDGWPEFAVSNPEADGGRGEIYIYTMGEVGAEDRPIAVRNLLLRVIPNPTRGSAWVRFSGVADAGATVGIYDLEGRLVRMLAGNEDETTADLLWDGRDTRGLVPAPGVYLTRLQGERTSVATPIVVIR